MRKFIRPYRSPFHQVAEVLKDIPLESLETVNPFVLAPWEDATVDDTATEQMEAGWAVRIAISSSVRNNMLEIGAVVRIPLSMRGGPRDESFKVTLGAQDGTEPVLRKTCSYTACVKIGSKSRHRRIVLATSNKAAVLTIKDLRQQSGQQYIYKAYDAMKTI